MCSELEIKMLIQEYLTAKLEIKMLIQEYLTAKLEIKMLIQEYLTAKRWNFLDLSFMKTLISNWVHTTHF